MTKFGERNNILYTIGYSKSFSKSLKKIDKQYHKSIKDTINDLIDNPYEKVDKTKNPNIVGSFKTRKGEYRILLDIINTNIQIHAVKHRKEVYKIK